MIEGSIPLSRALQEGSRPGFVFQRETLPLLDHGGPLPLVTCWEKSPVLHLPAHHLSFKESQRRFC